MELARAGEALLRSSQPLMPFLAPAAYRQPSRRIGASVSRYCRAQPPNQASRSFTTSIRRRADDDSKPSKPDTSTDDIATMLDSTLDFNKGTPTTPATRTTRFASSSAQSQNSSSRARASELSDGKSSMDEMLGMLLGKDNKRSGSVGSSLDPRGNSRPPPPAITEAPMKLSPTLGRTVYVDKNRGFDVAKAFRRMEQQVAKNAVRRDFNRQRFHERGGVKRKRLKSERWRRRFKEGFKAVVKRVLKMRKQGW